MENRFLNKKEFKPAMTMAEIMIVVLIIAIISLVFIAMPRKNVSKMDKAKYYIAYDMLKRLQDEQMVKGGSVSISGGIDTADEANFIHAADEWLNTLPDGSTPGCNAAARCITLTNGMILNWNSNIENALLFGENSRFLRVRVDIDGGDIPVNHWLLPNANGDLNSDVYEFRLYENGWVEPERCYDGAGCAGNQHGDININLPFRVYRYNDDGTINIIANNRRYYDAVEFYKCTANPSIPGCGANICGDRKCIMEAIPPLR